jgi:chromosome partitioning protein
MPVIAVISPKGGVGKTTSSFILGSQFAKAGYDTTMIDADPNQPLMAWSEKGRADNLTFVSNKDEDSIIDVIDAARNKSTIVIVDLEGTAGLVALHAVSQADFVIIPMQASELDAKETRKALLVIRDYKRMSNRDVPHAILFTRTSGAILTKTMSDIREKLDNAKIKILKESIMEREAFKLLFVYNRTLEQMQDKDCSNRTKAIGNAEAFMKEVATTLAALQGATHV